MMFVIRFTQTDIITQAVYCTLDTREIRIYLCGVTEKDATIKTCYILAMVEYKHSFGNHNIYEPTSELWTRDMSNIPFVGV